MKITSFLVAWTFSTLAFGSPPIAHAAMESLGRFEALGGGEKESGASAGARGGVELLGVLPFTERLGLQGVAHYVGGSGSRVGLSAGPLYDFGSGKAGIFAAYQYRSHHDNHFLHLRPSVTFYMGQADLNLFYSHPLSSAQRDGDSVERGINHLQGTLSYFPPTDLTSFMRKDNVEIILGVQANSFAGPGSGKIPNGVGPVVGFSFMPARNFEVNLIKGALDHHGRYRIGAGVSFIFLNGAANLRDTRRRYLEPNFFSPNSAAVTTGGAGCPPHDLSCGFD